MHNYESIAGAFPMTGVVDTRPNATALWVGWSGHARVLPLMEQGPMFNSINFTLAYSRADNYTVASTTISSFLCPSEKDPSPTPPSGFFNTPKAVSSYGLNMGDWFVFRPAARPTAASSRPTSAASSPASPTAPATRSWPARSRSAIPSTTASAPGWPTSTIPTTSPTPTADPYTVAPEYGGSCGAVGQGHTAWVDGNAQETGMTTAWPPNKQILGQKGEGDLDLQGTPLFRGGPTFAAITARSYHPGGVNAAFLDGSVRFVKSSIAAPIWRALGTIAGGEVISADAY